MAAPGLDATRWLFCYSCIQTLQNHKDAGAFLAPVDPVALGIPDYLSIIAQPMDLSTVRQKLASADPAKSSNPRPPYSIIDFVSDVHLIFRNCDVYNGAAHPVSKQGQRVKRKFDQIMEKLPALVILQTPLPVAGPASNTVDHVSQTFRTARAGRRTRSLSPPAGPTSKRIRMDLAPPTSSSDRAGSHKQASSSTTAVHPRPPPHGRSALTLSTQPSSPSASRPQQHLGPIPLARQPLGTKPAASALNTVARQPRGTKRATSPSNTIDSPAKRLAGARGRLTENAIPAKSSVAFPSSAKPRLPPKIDTKNRPPAYTTPEEPAAAIRTKRRNAGTEANVPDHLRWTLKSGARIAMDCATLDTQTGGGLIKGGLTRIAARRDRTVYIRNPGEALIGLMQDDLTVRIYYIAALEKPRARMYGQSFGRYGTDPYRNVRQTRFPATPTALMEEGTTALELAERNAITTVIFLNPGRVLRGHQLLGSFGVLLGRLLQARATVVFLSDMQDMAIEEYGLPEEVKAAYHELPVKIVGTNLELELTGRSAEEKAAAVERERLLSAGIS